MAKKKSKEVLHQQIFLPIYNQYVNFYISDDISKCITVLEKDHGGLKMEDDCIYAGGMSICVQNSEQRTKTFNILVQIEQSDWVDSIDNYCLSILTHECIHCAWEILENAGVEINANNHESLTYLENFLFIEGQSLLKKFIEDKLKQKSLEVKE